MGLFGNLFGKKELTAEEDYRNFERFLETNNFPLAFQHLVSAANKGHVEAQSLAGKVYADGKLVPKDDAKAFAYTSRAAAAGNIDAKYRLGFLYDMGRGTAVDKERALACWKEAGDAGHENAAYMYEHTMYFDYDQWELAMDLFYGRNGHGQDIPKALSILEKGANQFDHNAAWFLLGHIDIVGAEPYRPRNVSAGVQKMVRAAKGGDTEAFIWLMSMYRHGNPYEGVPFEKNEALAGAYAVEIADAIDEVANDLSNGTIHATAAWAYFHGHGVPVNYAKAAEYIGRIKPYFMRGLALEIRDELQKLGY